MGVLLEAVKLIYDKIDNKRPSTYINTRDGNEKEVNFKKIIHRETIDKIKSRKL